VALPQESARPPVARARTSFWRGEVGTSRRRTCAASPPSAGWSSPGRRVGSGNHRSGRPDEKVPGGGRTLSAPDHDPTRDLPRACGRSSAGSPPVTSSSPSVPATRWRRPPRPTKPSKAASPPAKSSSVPEARQAMGRETVSSRQIRSPKPDAPRGCLRTFIWGVAARNPTSCATESRIAL